MNWDAAKKYGAGAGLFALGIGLGALFGSEEVDDDDGDDGENEFIFSGDTPDGDEEMSFPEFWATAPVED